MDAPKNYCDLHWHEWWFGGMLDVGVSLKEIISELRKSWKKFGKPKDHLKQEILIKRWHDRQMKRFL